MALQLRSGDPAPVTVKLGGDAVVTVRPATMFEMDLAVAAAGKTLAGLIQGRDSAALVADMLGMRFAEQADFTSPEWVEAAAKSLIMINLATTCVTAWSGFVDDAGQVIEKPTRAMLALLLRSPAAARLIEDAMRSGVNVEYDEKNGLAASPDGGAAAAANIAPSADAQTSPAVAEASAAVDSDASKPSAHL